MKTKSKIILAGIAIMMLATSCNEEDISQQVIQNGEEVDASFIIELPIEEQTRSNSVVFPGERQVDSLRVLLYQRSDSTLVRNFNLKLRTDTTAATTNQTIVAQSSGTYGVKIKVPRNTYIFRMIGNEPPYLKLGDLAEGSKLSLLNEKMLATPPSYNETTGEVSSMVYICIGNTNNETVTINPSNSTSMNITYNFPLTRTVTRISHLRIRKHTDFNVLNTPVHLVSIRVANCYPKSWLMPNVFDYALTEHPELGELQTVDFYTPEQPIPMSSSTMFDIPSVKYFWENHYYSYSSSYFDDFLPYLIVTYEIGEGTDKHLYSSNVNIIGKDGNGRTVPGFYRNYSFYGNMIITDKDVLTTLSTSVVGWVKDEFSSDI